MDRSYKPAHIVNVYAKPTDRADGTPALKQVKRVPYSRCGFDNYEIGGVMLMGYSDSRDGAESCVFIGVTAYY